MHVKSLRVELFIQRSGDSELVVDPAFDDYLLDNRDTTACSIDAVLSQPAPNDTGYNGRHTQVEMQSIGPLCTLASLRRPLQAGEFRS
jgi:hypothetical protein